MSYIDTFIKVAEDCPINKSEVPVPRRASKPVHLIQYELLTQNPYKFNHEELIYEVYIRQNDMPENMLPGESEKIKEDLFSKGHPCLRASALTKRYAFGAHYNEAGKIAIYPQESEAYEAFMESAAIKKVPAMRSKR